ncbi:MAG: hypothetical protein HY942_07865 [Gammaproteobacteria bacterium]|nr:hypothetical protein [Gammaproteobacteria bacterium]
MLPYAVTIFLSAFLLFEVQLFLAKYILPWFGGVPAVWTTCMLFFQVLLLGGYGYAHWLAGRRSLRAQRAIHLALLAASLAMLLGLASVWGTPLLPDSGWKPAADETPILYILLLLTVSVGLPFFVLSATNPLLQAWFSRAQPGVSPYRLYALSNLGSLLGLVSYPFAVEVWVPLRQQSWLWTAGYLAFCVGIVAAGWRLGDTSARSAKKTAARNSPPPGGARYALWFTLAACASVLLLATTNQLTQDIAVVPFLWMLPLTLYLLSFILCFDSDRWYVRRFYLPALAAALAITTLLMEHGLKTHILGQIAIYSVTLFIACMVCHGELARLKPATHRLTAYYLAISVGGAFGGIFVGILAPYWFLGLWELPLGLWACAALVLSVLWRDKQSVLHRAGRPLAYGALGAAMLLVAFVFSEKTAGVDSPAALFHALGGGPSLLLAGAAGVMVFFSGAFTGWRQWPAVAAGGALIPRRSNAARTRFTFGAALAALFLFGAAQFAIATDPMKDAVRMTRNFYGLLAVTSDDADDPEQHSLKLRHGGINHGWQYQAPARRLEPSAYYGPNSGISYAFRHHPQRLRGAALRVAVIGLGTGTLAAYGRRGDEFRFYEINPDVLRLAYGADATFTYLNATPAAVSVALGDARLSLEREALRGLHRDFDLLAIDAFSSDSIPVHLLTREAFDVYLDRLADNGVLAIHISNRYVNLRPVIRRLAEEFGLDFTLIDSTEKVSNDEYSSDWVLLTRDGWPRAVPAIAQVAEQDPQVEHAPLWTDDYSNVFLAVRLGSVQETLSAVGGCLVFECPNGPDLPAADAPRRAGEPQ